MKLILPEENINDIDPVFGEVISRYTQGEAIEDGVLVLVGYAGPEKVIFTRTLFEQGFEDPIKRLVLVNKGIEMLQAKDNEDSSTMRLRVIEKNKIWVIWNQGEGITFLTLCG